MITTKYNRKQEIRNATYKQKYLCQQVQVVVSDLPLLTNCPTDLTNVVLNSRGAISELLCLSFKLWCQENSTDFSVRLCEDAKRIVDQVITRLRVSVDVWCNAGITQDKHRSDDEDFEKVIKINLTGAFNMTPSSLETDDQAREGLRLSTLSGVVSFDGNIGQANYAASAGLISLPSQLHVRLPMCVYQHLYKVDQSGLDLLLSDKVKGSDIGPNPNETFWSSRTIADATVFLAGQDYLTGQKFSC